MATTHTGASNTLQWCMSYGRRSNACLAHNLEVRLLELCRGYRRPQGLDFPSRIEMMVLPPGTAMISDLSRVTVRNPLLLRRAGVRALPLRGDRNG